MSYQNNNYNNPNNIDKSRHQYFQSRSPTKEDYQTNRYSNFKEKSDENEDNDDNNDKGAKLFIHNLNKTITNMDLEYEFSKYGEVIDTNIDKNKIKNTHTGMVIMKSRSNAEKAIEGLRKSLNWKINYSQYENNYFNNNNNSNSFNMNNNNNSTSIPHYNPNNNNNLSNQNKNNSNNNYNKYHNSNDNINNTSFNESNNNYRSRSRSRSISPKTKFYYDADNNNNNYKNPNKADYKERDREYNREFRERKESFNNSNNKNHIISPHSNTYSHSSYNNTNMVNYYSTTGNSNKVREIWVGNLPTNVNESLIYNNFFIYGEISEIGLNNEKNYAFIKYRLASSASKASEKTRNTELNGKILKASFSDNNKRKNIVGDEPNYSLNEKTCRLLHAMLTKNNSINENTIKDVLSKHGEITGFHVKHSGNRYSVYVEYNFPHEARRALDYYNKCDKAEENKKEFGDAKLELDFCFRSKEYLNEVMKQNVGANNLCHTIDTTGSFNKGRGYISLQYLHQIKHVDPLKYQTIVSEILEQQKKMGNSNTVLYNNSGNGGVSASNINLGSLEGSISGNSYLNRNSASNALNNAGVGDSRNNESEKNNENNNTNSNIVSNVNITDKTNANNTDSMNSNNLHNNGNTEDTSNNTNNNMNYNNANNTSNSSNLNNGNIGSFNTNNNNNNALSNTNIPNIPSTTTTNVHYPTHQNNNNNNYSSHQYSNQNRNYNNYSNTNRNNFSNNTNTNPFNSQFNNTNNNSLQSQNPYLVKQLNNPTQSNNNYHQNKYNHNNFNNNTNLPYQNNNNINNMNKMPIIPPILNMNNSNMNQFKPLYPPNMNNLNNTNYNRNMIPNKLPFNNIPINPINPLNTINPLNPNNATNSLNPNNPKNPNNITINVYTLNDKKPPLNNNNNIGNNNIPVPFNNLNPNSFNNLQNNQNSNINNINNIKNSHHSDKLKAFLSQLAQKQSTNNSNNNNKDTCSENNDESTPNNSTHNSTNNINNIEVSSLTTFEKEYSLEEENLNHLWSGFITRTGKYRVGVDVYQIRNECGEYFSDYNLNILQRINFEDVFKRPILGVVAISPVNETQCETFNEYNNYFLDKQKAGVVNLRNNITMYVIPQCDVSRKFYLNPKKHILGLFVNNTVEMSATPIVIPPPLISMQEKKTMKKQNKEKSFIKKNEDSRNSNDNVSSSNGNKNVGFALPDEIVDIIKNISDGDLIDKLTKLNQHSDSLETIQNNPKLMELLNNPVLKNWLLEQAKLGNH